MCLARALWPSADLQYDVLRVFLFAESLKALSKRTKLHTLYKGKKVVPKDLPSLKIHASPLRNSLAAEELAGGPRARARCVIRISRHGATRSLKPATGARQPLPSMIHVRARACNDDGCLCLTARTRKRGSTHIGQWQPRARGEHGL